MSSPIFSDGFFREPEVTLSRPKDGPLVVVRPVRAFGPSVEIQIGDFKAVVRADELRSALDVCVPTSNPINRLVTVAMALEKLCRPMRNEAEFGPR